MRSKLNLTMLFLGVAMLCATGAWGQTQTPPTPQFAFTGFIQEATLDPSVCGVVPADPRLYGGTITVNGIKIIVPCNTILQLPANTMTWADLFDPAQSTPVGNYIGAGAPAVPVPANPVVNGTRTGLALADLPSPFPSFEVSIVGNVVGKNADGTDQYIAALILPIEQQVLNGASGIVNYIDYSNGSLRVGGVLGDPTTGSLLQFNDPAGRWGQQHSIDPRFSGDNENTTIHASTGIPVCIPRVAPPAIDPLCPLGNRPLNGDPRFPVDPFIATGAPLKIFQMLPPPGQTGADPSGFPDARQQVPIMVGDQVLWIGTQYLIDPAGANTPANTYMSVHTLEDVLGIFTAPGVPPAYVGVEGILIGSGGAAIQGLLQEATTRLFAVGFTTDPTALIDIYAQDLSPCTGQESLRLLATTDPATQPLVGRFVHHVLGGNFGAPTRNYVLKSRTRTATDQIVANGIVAGQYLLPNFEFIVPENHRLGDPLIPGNYQDFPFLAKGSGPLDGFGTASPVVGQLDPWPGIPAPTPVDCTATGARPIVNAGPDITVGTGAQVLLAGNVTWDVNSTPASHTVQWTQTGGATLVTLQNANTPNASFLAPATLGPLTFTLTASDNNGTSTDSVIVTVGTPADTVAFTTATFRIRPATRRGGPFINLSVTATGSNPASTLTLTEIATDGSSVAWGTGAQRPPGVYNWREIKGAPTPASLIINSTGGGTATANCTVDARGRGVCQ